MSLNTMRTRIGNYPLPKIPNLCGPNDLARIISHYREHTPPAYHSPISKQGVRKLLALSFNASLMPEEGMYPQFRLVIRQPHDWFFVSAFKKSIQLKEVEVLRRLSPAFSHHESALWVMEHNGKLWCKGIMNISQVGLETRTGRPEFSSNSGPPSLHIQIKGPGHIIVDDGPANSYELRAGRIRQITPFYTIPAITILEDELGKTLMERVVEKEGTEARKYFGGDHGIGTLAIQMLSKIFRASCNMRRGSAFLILPNSDRSLEDYDIKCNYEMTGLDIGNDIVEFWISCVKHAKVLKTDNDRAVKSWNQRNAKLLTNVEILANLGSVDGCVVLNRTLSLRGFGGEITLTDADAKKSSTRFRNAKNGKYITYKNFMRDIGGTRHKSAARFCKVHDGVIAFVVSQEGELRVLYNDGDVYGFGPIDTSHSIDN